jgi:uncharacterized membrane protein
MSQIPGRHEYHIAKNRLETLVDGIFAIAMTLLVLTIAPPRPPLADAASLLPGMIFDLLPQILSFAIAFLVLGIFWLEHHRQFHFVRTVDPRLLWINIFLLISIAFVPFSTDVAGDYATVQIAVLLFNINIVIVGIIYAVQWWYICKSEHLCDPLPDADTIQQRNFQTLLIPAVAGLAVIISVFDPTLSLLAYLVIPPVAHYLRGKQILALT